MAILNFGEHLPPVYLERFSPPENQPVRLSVLSLQVVGVESHWVDLPTLGIKGMHRCTGGICCSSGAFGRRSQYYHLPVYVYNNPSQSAEGQLMDWSLTKTIYDSLVSVAQRYNLMEYDLDVVKTVQGQGTRTSFTLVPDVKLRSLWTPEQAQKINESVQMFFQIADTTLVQEANDQTYMDMLTQAGYNFETKQFPALPASNYHGANVAISQAVVPPMGTGQRVAPATGLPNVGGGLNSQPVGMPTPPQIGNPMQPQGVYVSSVVKPVTETQLPPQMVQPTAPTTASTFEQMAQATTPQTPQFMQQPIPQASFQTMQPQVPPVAPVPQNTIPQGQATELSSSDIDALLGDD